MATDTGDQMFSNFVCGMIHQAMDGQFEVYVMSPQWLGTYLAYHVGVMKMSSWHVERLWFPCFQKWHLPASAFPRLTSNPQFLRLGQDHMREHSSSPQLSGYCCLQKKCGENHHGKFHHKMMHMIFFLILDCLMTPFCIMPFMCISTVVTHRLGRSFADTDTHFSH